MFEQLRPFAYSLHKPTKCMQCMQRSEAVVAMQRAAAVLENVGRGSRWMRRWGKHTGFAALHTTRLHDSAQSVQERMREVTDCASARMARAWWCAVRKDSGSGFWS